MLARRGNLCVRIVSGVRTAAIGQRNLCIVLDAFACCEALCSGRAQAARRNQIYVVWCVCFHVCEACQPVRSYCILCGRTAAICQCNLGVVLRAQSTGIDLRPSLSRACGGSRI